MSTHKHFDKICCVVLVFTLLITILFINGEKLGIEKTLTVSEYENTLFDKSKVHSIDIIMDDWDEFTENARNEEYYNCSVVIDNEAFKNVAIRGKGNTSLSSVTNGRYSYKIEFDHYDSTNTYYGLDKLCLNNIIQDNTYMKDYLTYTMMSDMGVASPLCSFVYITVNGEDWGLYLAVEGVEESFLKRNYGKDYGELYKPDSLSMGGGRGNGDDFDIDAFMGDFNSFDNMPEATTEPETTTEVTTTQPAEESTTQIAEESTTQATESTTEEQSETTTAFDFNNLPEGMTPPADFNGELPEGFTIPEDFNGELPEGFTLPDNFNGELPEGFTVPDDFNGENPFGSNNPFGSFNPFGSDNPFGSFNPFSSNKTNGTGLSVSGMSANSNTFDSGSSQGGSFGGMTPPDFSGGDFFNGEMPEGMTPPTDENGNFQMPEGFDDMFSGGFGGFGGMGSSDVKLQYIDDNISSYENIFENSKTDATTADKKRLIEALKNLSNGEDLTNTVDIEEVIRYFVVHNFAVNSDSYTGAMIHNYYLYEKDGQMQMIPWDYNLAFGSFMSTGSATSSVNDPIDTPLSVSGSGDRPMIDWIFSNEEYTELYHKYFNEFIEEYFDSGYFEEMIDSVKSMISPYVEKDPTKFCTYEEFEKGISTLREFCLLRAESVRGQLDGTIGSTSATQNSDTLIDADGLDISSMGSMGMGGGMDFPGGNMQKPQGNSDSSADTDNGNNGAPQMPDNFNGGFNGQMPSIDKGSSTNDEQSQFKPQSSLSAGSVASIILCFFVLVFGLVFAKKYKRRKH